MAAFESAARITPFLWFDGQAEEAANLYVSIFKNSKVLEIARNSNEGYATAGVVLTVHFELDGTRFTALNGGPLFKFNESVSFVVRCDSQEEVDYYWDRLVAGGTPSQCGWLKDRFGLSWQITPAKLPEWIKSPKAMAAMMTMGKLDIAALEAAAKE